MACRDRSRKLFAERAPLLATMMCAVLAFNDHVHLQTSISGLAFSDLTCPVAQVVFLRFANCDMVCAEWSEPSAQFSRNMSEVFTDW